MKYLVYLLVICVTSIPAYAGLGDLDLEEKRYASMIAGDTGEAQTLGGTVILPIQIINGGVAVSALRTSITHEEETIVSDDIQYRIQGGPMYKGASLQFYIEGDYGKHQDRGLFIRPGSLDVQGWHISGGIGSYIRGLHEELRIDETEPDTLVKPIAFISLTHKLGDGILSVLTTWSPTFSFDAHDLLIEPQFTVELSKFNLTLTGRFGEQHEMRVKEYLGQIDWPF